MLSVVVTIAASATEAPAAAGYKDKPDWVITEVCPDQRGDGRFGYDDNADPLEFFEIYNNSGRTLNLYDYCMTYNGYGRSHEKFETRIVETTPFKGPDWRDKSFEKDYEHKYGGFSGVENLPKNPDTCMVKPGEVVVVWSLYFESLVKKWNGGKGLSVADFRAFWNVPDDVKVICFDGNSDADTNGHIKNFNIKNSSTGTYGICLKSEAIDALANTDDEANSYPVNYYECPELCYWITVDFDEQISTSLHNACMSSYNVTYNFVYDADGIGADEFGFVKDTRRGLLAEMYRESTPGKLTALQKMCLGIPVEAGDTFSPDDVYVPVLIDEGRSVFNGFRIGDKIYKPDPDATEHKPFVFDKGGIFEIEYMYGSETPEETHETTSDTTPVPETTPAPETTPVPETTTPVTTPAPEEPKKGGCGSSAALGLLSLIIPAGIAVRKKKH